MAGLVVLQQSFQKNDGQIDPQRSGMAQLWVQSIPAWRVAAVAAAFWRENPDHTDQGKLQLESEHPAAFMERQGEFRTVRSHMCSKPFHGVATGRLMG